MPVLLKAADIIPAMRRLISDLPELVMIFLIVGFAAVNAMVYGGFVIGEASGNDARTTLPLPPGNAPVIDEASPSQVAEYDASADLPGTYAPPQGRAHVRGTWPLADELRVEFCPPGENRSDCYASNPPTSGLHLPVQRNAPIGDGVAINIPPDPGIYPIEIPRESIPHLQEHAGVFVGYNCSSAGCERVRDEIEQIVQEELTLEQRVVMAPDSDLAADTIGLASWTRYDVFAAGEYDEGRVRAFIQAHSCRFDPERFCDD
jgi:hypothetical protein